MTVIELIEELQQCPSYDPVEFQGMEIDSVASSHHVTTLRSYDDPDE